jgi:hypothetical protein
MCDYSLHAVASRPAKAGETLITTSFRGAGTRGFAAEAKPEVAVCLLPGTELAFADAVAYDDDWGLEKDRECQSCSFSQNRAECFISAS